MYNLNYFISTKSKYLILSIAFCSSCTNNNQQVIQNEDIVKSNGINSIDSSSVLFDSSECLEVFGIGASCPPYFLVCPGDYLYSSTILLKHINNNLSEDSMKVPESCCRRFDTLSAEKKIYLLTICYGGPYTETWVYAPNEYDKFVLKHFWKEYNMKLESKTNGVNDFFIYYPNPKDDTTISAAIMKYNGDAFDTFKLVSQKELNDPRWPSR